MLLGFSGFGDRRSPNELQFKTRSRNENLLILNYNLNKNYLLICIIRELPQKVSYW